MQALVKVPTRINRFVPHSSEAGPAPKVSAGALSPVPLLKPEPFDQLAHDARNILSALRLYCDLLAEPDVLTTQHLHYAQELHAVVETASRLVERLAAPRRGGSRRGGSRREGISPPAANARVVRPKVERGPADSWPGERADDIGAELMTMRPLLVAIAGPHLELEIEACSCGGRTRLSREDLTRVMLNLVRNASEAISKAGKLRITAQYGDGFSFLAAGEAPDACPHKVVIAVEDNGPGIPEGLCEEIFSAGFTTRSSGLGWPETPHRGLGLSIVRSLVEAAGGTVHARSSPSGGARFEIELPITSGMYEIADGSGFMADSSVKGCIECP